MGSLLHLLNQTPVQLRDWLAQRGLPAYRADQVRHWLFQRRAGEFAEMTDLPVALRRQLADEFCIWTSRVTAHRQAADGTEKLLLQFDDGQQTECVLLRDDTERRTICISTQIGCAIGCAFCASGLGGLVRNLTSGEIIEQMLRLQRLLHNPAGLCHTPERGHLARPLRPRRPRSSERLSHIVVMGMGEPLANLDALLPALAVATDAAALGISARRITISSVGLPKGIRRLAELDCQYHLAVSLHAPDDELRNRLVPINRSVGIAAVLAAADHYFERTGRRVTYEYVLLAEVNDRPEQARRLAALLKGRPALVNLIPYNPVADLPYHTPAPAAVAQFAELLRQAGLNVELRRRKGDRIDAACGQLRRRAEGGGRMAEGRR